MRHLTSCNLSTLRTRRFASAVWLSAPVVVEGCTNPAPVLYYHMIQNPTQELEQLLLGHNQRTRLDALGRKLEAFFAAELTSREQEIRASAQADLKKAAALTDKYWTQSVALNDSIEKIRLAVEALQTAGEWSCPGLSPEQTKKLWQAVKDAIEIGTLDI